MSTTKLYTYEEVAKHNNRSDLWIIIEGKVYDITKFQDEHPGGEEVLLDEGAKDGTGAFEDVGHSDDARELLKKYYVGDVDPNSKPIKVERPVEVIPESPKGNPFRILIPFVLIAAYVYYNFIL
ncbi:cytochrome b5-like heme/steroid binding domain-containing protein [Cokeromyces recurvatus]|uniref:cytochrome b5-like heme/steroid binding domain-containing protein n=1 Tax=Cokeromyces recurvatus TaxID=90255 RepID=UPI0022212AA2|nr:cytochrome b5-like heme/steroid binding domain-containing protein [Cokeromyces recurvatus]KAI7906304.1 cytochrome b5-like heme/steroid binding domain-containing protein [Cokeromyces recurvatus]